MRNSTLAEQKTMIEAYKLGFTEKEAAALFGYSERVCYDALKRLGIRARTTSEAMRKYNLNHHFFDEVDSESKAYWLGILASDGGITGEDVRLLFQRQDRNHLQKLLDDIKSDYPIHDIEKKVDEEIRKYSSIKLHSPQMVKALSAYGVIERKSLTYVPPDNLPEDLERHFFRGCVDGDGSIFFVDNPVAVSITLAGSKPMVQKFMEFASKHISSRAHLRPLHNGHIFAVEYKGTNIPRKLIFVLYGDATIFLDRKKKAADKALAMRPQKNNYFDVKREDVDKLYKEHNSWRIVGEKLGLKPFAIYGVKNRLGL